MEAPDDTAPLLPLPLLPLLVCIADDLKAAGTLAGDTSPPPDNAVTNPMTRSTTSSPLPVAVYTCQATHFCQWHTAHDSERKHLRREQRRIAGSLTSQ